MNDRAGTSRSFSPALDRLCSFVAVSQSQSADAILRQLLMQCMVILPDQAFAGNEQFTECLDALFGLQMPAHRVQEAIDALVADRKITRSSNGAFFLDPSERAAISTRIAEAESLQGRVSSEWLAEARAGHPSVGAERAWKALQEYLSRSFRRHGMQTVALLDVTNTANPVQSESLASMLTEAVKGACPESERPEVEAMIREFFATLGKNPDRTRFVVQLADGAFSYFSLTVPPDVAEQLRSKLADLTLFLDTNFLFGILDLHANPLVDVSREVLHVIKDHRLPFKLRYHEATEREMKRTIGGIASELRSHHWPQAVSRAAVRSRNVSGIEQRFHSANAASPISAETFFKPFEHLDILLKDFGILIYRAPDGRAAQRADLLHDYNAYLTRRGKEKPYETIDHDVIVLDSVRHARSRSRSSLEAKALFVTCDYVLSRFDWETGQGRNELACTVLPNQLLQLLRPFIPASSDFDESFAKTFAIPEFRTLASGAAAAASRLLGLLTAYEGIREDTAAAMLANDMVLDSLRKTKDHGQAQRLVESAMVTIQQDLLEESAALKAQLERESRERLATDAAQRRRTEELGAERDALAARLRLESEKAERELAEASTSRDQAERASQEAAGRADVSERRLRRALTAVAAIAALGFAFVAEFALGRWGWPWLLQHPNSYGIRAGLYLTALLLSLGLARESWRRWCWGAGCLAIAVSVVQILGGPVKR